MTYSEDEIIKADDRFYVASTVWSIKNYMDALEKAAREDDMLTADFLKQQVDEVEKQLDYLRELYEVTI